MPDENHQMPSYFLSVTRRQLRRIEKDNMQIRPLHGHLCKYGDPITFFWKSFPKTIEETIFPYDIWDMIHDPKHAEADRRDIFIVEIKIDHRHKLFKFEETVKKFKVRKEFCNYLSNRSYARSNLIATQDVIQKAEIVRIGTRLILYGAMAVVDYIYTESSPNINHIHDKNIRSVFGAKLGKEDFYYAADIDGKRLRFVGYVDRFGLVDGQKTLMLVQVNDIETYLFYRNHVWLLPDENPVINHESFLQYERLVFNATVKSYPDNPNKFGLVDMEILSKEFSDENAEKRKVGMESYNYLHTSQNKDSLPLDKQYKVAEYGAILAERMRKNKILRRKERKKLKRK